MEKVETPSSTTLGDGTRDQQKATVKNVDMTDEMQQESIEIAQMGMEAHPIEKDIAAFCKREFDKKFGPTWHVVVGKNFGSYVTHGAYNSFPYLWPHSNLFRQ